MGKYLIESMRVKRRGAFGSEDKNGGAKIVDFGESFDEGEADTLEGARKIAEKAYSEMNDFDRFYNGFYVISKIVSRDEYGFPENLVFVEEKDFYIDECERRFAELEKEGNDD